MGSNNRIKRHDISAILLHEKIKKGFFDHLVQEDEDESPRIQEEYFDEEDEESDGDEVVNDRSRINLRKRNALKRNQFGK